MSQRKWLLTAGVAALLLGALGAASAVGQEPQRARAIVKRVERVIRYPERWRSECDFDSCGVSLLLRMPVTTPTSAQRVDVVMSTTLDYRTSPGDFGVAFAGIARPGQGGVIDMRPNSWPLAPSAPRSTTSTLTWVKKGLRAQGRRYLFQLSIPSREGTDPGANQNAISGRRLAVVVELTPSG